MEASDYKESKEDEFNKRRWQSNDILTLFGFCMTKDASNRGPWR